MNLLCCCLLITYILLCQTGVHGDEICINVMYTATCDSGYECCENNTKCCYKGLSVGAIVGIVFGILFVLTVCFVCALIVTKKKNGNKVVGTSFNNQPLAQTVTINGLNGCNGPPMNPGQYGQYGGFASQPHPPPGMMPPPYGSYPNYTQPGQPMVPAPEPSYPPVRSAAANSMFGPLAPAYTVPSTQPWHKSG